MGSYQSLNSFTFIKKIFLYKEYLVGFDYGDPTYTVFYEANFTYVT
jgi:hypothetical protein